MKKWNLVIDVEKCEGCNNCFMACKDEHVGNDFPGYASPQPDHGHRWMNIMINIRGQYSLIDLAYLPMPCMHCDNAPCIKAAENNAIFKRKDGIVIINPDKAKGQKNIARACPYGAIWWNDEKEIPQKCTLCAHLLDRGWKQTRCVQSCPTGALIMHHVEDAKMQEIIKAEKLEVYQPEHKTSPRVYYKNLYRFTRCFIGGSIAVRVDGKDECAQGATVTLFNAANKRIGKYVTDNYGDFKFDNLKENSGKYMLQIAYTGYGVKTIEVNLKESFNVGTIYL